MTRVLVGLALLALAATPGLANAQLRAWRVVDPGDPAPALEPAAAPRLRERLASFDDEDLDDSVVDGALRGAAVGAGVGAILGVIYHQDAEVGRAEAALALGGFGSFMGLIVGAGVDAVFRRGPGSEPAAPRSAFATM